jgi:hypothetical protein
MYGQQVREHLRPIPRADKDVADTYVSDQQEHVSSGSDQRVPAQEPRVG